MRQPDQVVELDEVDPARRVAWDELCVRCGAGYFAGPVWATSWYDSFGDGAPTQVGVRFAHGGGNRKLNVIGVEVDGVALDVEVFLSRFAVGDDALGRWIREAVERALDDR